jgi:hypothetical protein
MNQNTGTELRAPTFKRIKVGKGKGYRWLKVVKGVLRRFKVDEGRVGDKLQAPENIQHPKWKSLNPKPNG